MSVPGSAKLRTTWLQTSAFVGSTPTPRMMRVGTTASMRRASAGIGRLPKPVMTTSPVCTPTRVDASPEASRATASMVAAICPACAPSAA